MCNTGRPFCSSALSLSAFNLSTSSCGSTTGTASLAAAVTAAVVSPVPPPLDPGLGDVDAAPAPAVVVAFPRAVGSLMRCCPACTSLLSAATSLRSSTTCGARNPATALWGHCCQAVQAKQAGATVVRSAHLIRSALSISHFAHRDFTLRHTLLYRGA